MCVCIYIYIYIKHVCIFVIIIVISSSITSSIIVLYIYIYMNTHVCVYIYIYAHTHIYIYTYRERYIVHKASTTGSGRGRRRRGTRATRNLSPPKPLFHRCFFQACKLWQVAGKVDKPFGRNPFCSDCCLETWSYVSGCRGLLLSGGRPRLRKPLGEARRLPKFEGSTQADPCV